MANLAYRSIATGNWSTTTTWQVYSLTASGGVFGSGGTWGTASDYPKTGDYVWIQSTFVVTYDATAISTNNSATFAQISNRIDINGSAIAQPGTGGTNATSGYVALSVASTTTINASQYSMSVGSTGLFNSTVTNTTFNFTGNNNEGTTSVFFYANTGSGLTVNFTGTVRGGSTSGRTIYINAASSTCNVIGDVYAKAADAIYMPGGSSTCNITGNVYGSDTNTAVYAVNGATGSLTVSITGNEYSGVNSSCVYAAAAGSSVTITGNVRNYGTSGTSSYMANICPTVNLRSTSTQSFRTSDAGTKDFTTSGATSVTEASIWAYLTSSATTSGSLGKLISDNLNATISSRASQTSLDTVASYVDTEVAAIKAKTDNIPNNPSSVESVGAQISSIFP